MLGPILRGQHISLAPPRVDDLPTFCAWLADLEVTRYMLVRFPLSLRQEEEWFDRVARDQNQVIWRIVADDRTIGTTVIEGIDWLNRGGSTGLFIGVRTEWGKGYASEAVQLRTNYAFQELGLERLETESFAENAPMHRALEKAGYQKIGRKRRAIYRGGEWHDKYIFELLRDDWRAR